MPNGSKTHAGKTIITRFCSFNPLFVLLLWHKLHIFMTHSDSFTFVYYWLNVGYCAAHGVQPWTVNWTKIHPNSQNETSYCCHKYKHLKVETDKICILFWVSFSFDLNPSFFTSMNFKPVVFVLASTSMTEFIIPFWYYYFFIRHIFNWFCITICALKLRWT